MLQLQVHSAGTDLALVRQNIREAMNTQSIWEQLEDTLFWTIIFTGLIIFLYWPWLVKLHYMIGLS